MLPLPPPPPTQRKPRRDWEARRDLYLSTGGQDSYLRTREHWRVCCCAEGACEQIDWGWVVELIGEEEPEVVLTLSFVA